jgi:DDE superfamily endonuclease
MQHLLFGERESAGNVESPAHDPLGAPVPLAAEQSHSPPYRLLARHPRVQFHFTPTSASWLNLVERFFSELTERRLRRLAVSSVDELIDAITRYIDRRNQNPTPFVWTATVRQIMKKVNKVNETLATLH